MTTQNSLGLSLQLTPAEIRRLRDEYVSNKKEMAREDEALAAGKRIAAGDFSRENLMSIVRWKSSRPTGLVGSNRDDEISDALRLAVDAKTPRAAVAVLCGLRGVDVPVASAILTMIDPDIFTVIDVRALETLKAPELSSTVDNYLRYLEFCKRKAAEHNVPMRDLDRALWQKSKDAALKHRLV